MTNAQPTSPHPGGPTTLTPVSPLLGQAQANLDNLRRIFLVPEDEGSTLAQIERDLSKNLLGFLREHIVTSDRSPSSLEKDFQDTVIPEEPLFVSEQARFLLEKVVAQSVHTASPSFVGHMTSAMPYFMLPLAKIMIALNQNLVKIETAKAFTPLERQVIAMLHRLVFQKDDAYYRTNTHAKEVSLGTFCSGGTVANISGLWVARNRLLSPKGQFQNISEDGLAAGLRAHGYEGLAVLVSRRGHYSLKKAADVLGIGKRHLIGVPTTAENKIDIPALQRHIAELREARMGILAIVGIAGTTETGNVDPLDTLADIAKEVGCGFHVDAAWGGPTLMSQRYKHLLKGIERADSVTMDAHKQLYCPMGAGMVLYRDEHAILSVEQQANYIIRRGSRDLGKHTLEGSRPGMALLAHSGLRIIGRKGYELLIDLGVGKAKQFAKLIQATPDFELITEPELNLLTYRYRPPRWMPWLEGKFGTEKFSQVADLLNEMTRDIQRAQRAAGKTFVSRTTLEPVRYGGHTTTVFRVVLANPLTTRPILAAMLEEQRSLAQGLLEKTYATRFQEIAGDAP